MKERCCAVCRHLRRRSGYEYCRKQKALLPVPARTFGPCEEFVEVYPMRDLLFLIFITPCVLVFWSLLAICVLVVLSGLRDNYPGAFALIPRSVRDWLARMERKQ